MKSLLVPSIKAQLLRAGAALHCCPTKDLKAAVAIVLVEREELSLLLIKKCEKEGYDWSGHMAFPGGRVDETDPTLLDTALRELFEEVGIAESSVEQIASLGTFQTHIKNLSVEAFLFLWQGRDEIKVHEAEVEWAIEVPLAQFLNHHLINEYGRKNPDELGLDLQYPVGEHIVWGLTARMLYSLLETLRSTLL